MNKHIAGVALALGLATSLNAPAHAFTPGGTFTLTGPASLSNSKFSIACTAVFAVSAPTSMAPNGEITSVAFTGGTLGICATISAIGLPWPIDMLSPTSVQITGVTLNYPVPPNCTGPATLVGAWDNTSPGHLILTGATVGACTLSVNLSANPPQTLP